MNNMPTKFPVYIQRRKHRAKRVNKKWMKRYGFKCNWKQSVITMPEYAEVFITRKDENGESYQVPMGTINLKVSLEATVNV
jgi:hypothetical protein